MPQPKKRSLIGTKNVALASHVKAARVRSAAAAGASSSAEPIAEMDAGAGARCTHMPPGHRLRVFAHARKLVARRRSWFRSRPICSSRRRVVVGRADRGDGSRRRRHGHVCLSRVWVAGAGGGGAVAGGVGVADVTERNAGARQLPRQEVELRELLSRCSQAAGHTAFQHELESIQSSKKSKADKARSVEALRIRMKRFLDDAGAGGASWPRAEEERPAEAGRPPPVRFDDGTGTDERGVGRREAERRFRVKRRSS